eukprot:3878387-Pyramimonas_sp.AAC.1
MLVLSQVTAHKDAYLSAIKRMYPRWKKEVDGMVKTQAAKYEEELRVIAKRREQAAKDFQKELEDRSRLMHGQHAAQQVRTSV